MICQSTSTTTDWSLRIFRTFWMDLKITSNSYIGSGRIEYAIGSISISMHWFTTFPKEAAHRNVRVCVFLISFCPVRIDLLWHRQSSSRRQRRMTKRKMYMCKSTVRRGVFVMISRTGRADRRTSIRPPGFVNMLCGCRTNAQRDARTSHIQPCNRDVQFLP